MLKSVIFVEIVIVFGGVFLMNGSNSILFTLTFKKFI